MGHDKAMLLMHTDIRDPNGQDLEAIIYELGLTDGQVIFSTEKGPKHAIIEYDGLKDHFDNQELITDENFDDFYTTQHYEREKALETYGYKFIRLNKFNTQDNPVKFMDTKLKEVFSEKEKQVEIDPNPLAATLDELNDLLEKEKQKSLRLLADYQNLEKQTIDRINARSNKIILDFLTVYEDFIRTKDAYEKEGGNVDSLNGIIKNMVIILDHYEVKPIEAEGKKLDPKLHEVVQEIEDNDHEEGTIVKEITKGYIIRDEVIKYSKVCVSKKLIKK